MKTTLLTLLCTSIALAQDTPQTGRSLVLIDSPANPASTRASAPGRKSLEASDRAARAFAFTPPQAAGGNQANETLGCTVDPASPAIGTDIPASYFGAPASSVNPSFVGRLQTLKSGPLDEKKKTIELPLYQGKMAGSGESVWYILTDTTDAANAAALGLNHSSKLSYGATGRGARNATLLKGGVLEFESGKVDFSPQRRVTPATGASPFPPTEAIAGSVGDRNYSPLVRIVNAGGHVYNAPIIAFNATPAQMVIGGRPNAAMVHDKVVSFNFAQGTVTLALTPGFSFGRPVLYLSTEASAELVAAMEGATLAPGLGDIATGVDDSAFSAVERIFVFLNGARGCDNPQRQGLEAALTDGGAPINVLGGIPSLSTDYSPLWDLNLGEWTAAARSKNFGARMIDEFQTLAMVDAGLLTGPGGSKYGSVGIIINCSMVFRFL